MDTIMSFMNNSTLIFLMHWDPPGRESSVILDSRLDLTDKSFEAQKFESFPQSKLIFLSPTHCSYQQNTQHHVSSENDMTLGTFQLFASFQLQKNCCKSTSSLFLASPVECRKSEIFLLLNNRRERILEEEGVCEVGVRKLCNGITLKFWHFYFI